MTIASGTKLGRYEIRSKLGAGGMGEVYLAQDTTALDRTVALKILPVEVAADKDRLQRFTQEARTVSNLNHPNILTIYEFGQADSACFIATEFVDGETLRQYLSGRRLKILDVLDIAVQIVAALNAAHEAGVVHRDIKPENVMLRRDRIVKVLDFGLAKPAQKAASSSVDSEAGTKVLVHTEPGLVMGTVSYMSPEQSAGSGVDHRTDIWSAGVLLYEMLAGVLPFEGKDIHRQIIAIQEQDPAPLSHHVEGVPARLEEIVVKCLAKDKDERYQTAKDLLIDLRNLKRRLDVDAEIERTVAPELRPTSGGAARAGTQSSQPDTETTNARPARTTSSAEYLVGQVQQHKGRVVIAVGVFALAIAAIAYYLHARNTEVAIESIAVLPFVNQNHDADSEYLSDGVTESIINSLTQLPNLKVIARSSVFRYKGKETDPLVAGRELGVRAVLTGRIMHRGDDLTISTELVDVRDNKQLWGEQYREKVSDLLSVQREIASKITGNLRLKLSGTEQSRVTKRYTENPEAYQLYLKGRFYWNKRTGEALKKSIEYFNQAIERDPNYALAYAGLADAYVLLPNYSGGSPQESFPKAKAAAKRALELDETLAEAHASLADALFLYDRNFLESNREFQRAIALNPNYATGHQWYGNTYLVRIGRFDEGIAEGKRAQELDPLSLIINTDLGENYLYARQYDKAIEQLRRTIEIDQSFYAAHYCLAEAYDMKGSLQEATLEYQKARQLNDDPWVLALLGHLFAAAGKRDEALKTLDQLKDISNQRYVSPYGFALVYAGLNEKDLAFQWLERSYKADESKITRLKVDPLLDNLRSDPRFSDVMRRVGLPQ
jgi:serine/threonine protein kinase/Tfp pilus assembly protein PilF